MKLGNTARLIAHHPATQAAPDFAGVRFQVCFGPASDAGFDLAMKGDELCAETEEGLATVSVGALLAWLKGRKIDESGCSSWVEVAITRTPCRIILNAAA